MSDQPNTKEDNFLSIFFEVIFVFALGVGILMGLTGILYFVGIDWLWLNIKHVSDEGDFGFGIIISFGCLAIALAIYDGQFIGKVKRTHWSKKSDKRGNG